MPAAKTTIPAVYVIALSASPAGRYETANRLPPTADCGEPASGVGLAGCACLAGPVAGSTEPSGERGASTAGEASADACGAAQPGVASLVPCAGTAAPTDAPRWGYRRPAKPMPRSVPPRRGDSRRGTFPCGRPTHARNAYKDASLANTAGCRAGAAPSSCASQSGPTFDDLFRGIFSLPTL